ncbi:MAG TPA: hypothetical protein PKL83_07150 [bacterium]|nr:hypothetical protein [bacterium]
MAYVAVIGQSPSKSQPRVRRKHAIKIRMRFGFISLTAVTIALGCVLSILYFMQINRLTMAGYQISELEKQISGLREDNKRLSYDVAQNKALTLVELEATERLHMVPAEEVQYWWGEDAGALAARQ